MQKLENGKLISVENNVYGLSAENLLPYYEYNSEEIYI